MLFEETSSYHKASRCETERLMLSIHYVLQRRPPPDRPALTDNAKVKAGRLAVVLFIGPVLSLQSS